MPAEIYGPLGALAVLGFVVAAFIRGDIVPGYIFRRERDKRELADTQAERNATALAIIAKRLSREQHGRVSGRPDEPA